MGLREVAWPNALLPWILMATVFYTGILFSFWKAARDGKLESGPLTTKLRTHWWPIVALAAIVGVILLGLVISKAYDASRWPLRTRGMSKAVWIGLIPVLSVLSASCLSLLLFVPRDAADSPPAAAPGKPAQQPDAAPPEAGAPCVSCGEATTWKPEAQRFRCGSCRVYQPVGPKAV